MNSLLKLFVDRNYLISTLVLGTVVYFSLIAVSIAGGLALVPFEIARGGGEILIYNKNSLVITGLIPASVVDGVDKSAGGNCTPAVLAPSLVNDKTPLIVRGLPEEGIQQLAGIEPGGGVFAIDNYSALVGWRASTRLRVRVGEPLLLRGILSGNAVAVVVKGVYKSDTLLDDEIIVSLSTARLLRGAGGDEYSVVVCKTLNDESLRLLESLTANTSMGYSYKISVPSWLISLIEAPGRSGFRGVLEVRGFGDIVSVSRAMSILGISGSLLISTATLAVSASYYYKSKRRVLYTLLELSLNRKKVRRLALLALTTLFVLGYLTGLLLAEITARYVSFQFLFHSVNISLSFENTLIYTIGLIILYSLVAVREVKLIGEQG